MINIKKEKKYVVLSIIILIIIWKLIAIWVGKPIIIPSPEATFIELVKIIRSKIFILAVAHTFRRMVIGFVITFVSAVVLGMLSGFYDFIYYLLKPIVTLFKAVPTMAIILLAIIWLKSETAPILVAFLVVFPLLYENVVQGIREVDQHLIEMVRVYKVGRIRVIKDIYLPSIQSYLMAGISTAIGLNVKIIIAAEVLCQPYISIGTSFQMEKSNLNTAGVFAWSIIAIMIVGIFEVMVKLIKRNSRYKV